LINPFPLAERLPQLFRLPGSGVPNPAQGANPRMVAGTMATILPLSLCFIFFAPGKKWRFLGILATLVLTLPFVLSQSPQGYIALALAVSLILIFRFPWTVWLQVPIGLLTLWTWSRWRWWLSPDTLSRLDFGFESRHEIWRRGLLMLADMPFTGSGLNTYALVSESYGPLTDLMMPHAHNVFLQTANDQGIPGLLIFILLFALAFWVTWRGWTRVEDARLRAALLGCVGSCGAFLGYGLWDSMSLGNKPAIILWAVLGLMVGLNAGIRPKLWSRINIRKRRIIIGGFTLLALVTITIWGSGLSVNVGRVFLHKAMQDTQGIGIQAYETADRFANYAASLDVDNPRVYVLSGMANLSMGNDIVAIDDFERALAIDTNDFGSHYYLAEIYHRLGQNQPALLHWEVSESVDLLYQRGREAFDAGDLTLAEEWFNFVMDIDPLHQGASGTIAQICYQRSHTAATEDNYSRAEEQAACAIANRMDNGWFRAWLGDLYWQQGYLDKALDQYYSIPHLVDDPTWDWRSLQRSGRLHTAQQDWERAIDDYQTAAEISLSIGASPQDQAQNLALLGKVLSAAGHQDKAKEVLQQALEFDGDNKLALEELTKLP
jgi:tetratricopeptide (TPR) repeat protein